MSDQQYTFGEVNWDNVDTSSASNTPRIPFLIMKDPGDYEIRIVSKPYQYYHHWVNDISGAQKKVNCTCDEKTCPVCKIGTKETKAKPHWLFKVINRTESAKQKKTIVNVLDCGSQILTAISDLKNNSKWGSVIQYDVTIKRGPKGRNPLYTVHPCPKEPLTEEEKNAIRATANPDDATYIDLEKIGKPWTPEKINSVISGAPAGVSAASVPPADNFGDELDELNAPAAPAVSSPTTSAPAQQPKEQAQPKTTQQSSADDEDFLDL